MAGAQARPRLGHLALEALRWRAHRSPARRGWRDWRPVCCMLRTKPRIEGRLERRRLRRHLAALDRAAFGEPFLQAAIEHAHVGVAERQEHPPRPRRGDPAAGIIDHDGIVVADAERADVAAELLGVGKHVRQRVGMIGHRIDIEEHRARNMRGEIIVLRQRQHARQLERGVDDLDVGIVEMRGEPFGGDERIGGGHDAILAVIPGHRRA